MNSWNTKSLGSHFLHVLYLIFQYELVMYVSLHDYSFVEIMKMLNIYQEVKIRPLVTNNLLHILSPFVNMINH